MFNVFKKNVALNLLVFSLLIAITAAGAMDEKPELEAQGFPSLFAVYQQQGPTCPWIPFDNLIKVREIRGRNEEGKIILQDSDYVTKCQSYAWFLPRIRTLDCAYDVLRKRQGPYAAYEMAIRSEGIKSNARYNEEGKPVGSIDFWQTDQARRKNYTPYNIKVEESPYYGWRWVPLFHNKDDNQIYFYDYTSSKTRRLQEIVGNNYDCTTDYHLSLLNGGGKSHVQILCRFDDDMLQKMGISMEEIKGKRIIVSSSFLGSKTAYYIQKSPEEVYNKEEFYEVGTFQHMLFACGLNRDNEPLTEADEAFAAYQEFHAVFQENPLNPWGAINKNDLFEYHLAHIFKHNSGLKNMAMEAVNYYNNCWAFYKESFDFYDSPYSPRTKFSDKQKYLPGEDQMLAYFFSSQLRFTWGASVGLEALIAIQELDDELGEDVVSVLKFFDWMFGVPSVSDILSKAAEKKFGSGDAKYSFLDAWEQIKNHFIVNVTTPLNQIDFVAFSGHGCVISFDPDLVQRQFHENQNVAERLGVAMWETLYEKGIKPFYQKPGTAENLVKF